MSYDVTSPHSEVRRSINELSADSAAYMIHARQLRRQEAESLVRGELNRIAAARPTSTADWFARSAIILALVGLLASSLVFGLSFLIR